MKASIQWRNRTQHGGGIKVSQSPQFVQQGEICEQQKGPFPQVFFFFGNTGFFLRFLDNTVGIH